MRWLMTTSLKLQVTDPITFVWSGQAARAVRATPGSSLWARNLLAKSALSGDSACVRGWMRQAPVRFVGCKLQSWITAWTLLHLREQSKCFVMQGWQMIKMATNTEAMYTHCTIQSKRVTLAVHRPASWSSMNAICVHALGQLMSTPVAVSSIICTVLQGPLNHSMQVW